MLSWLKDSIKGVKGEQDCIFCKIRDNPINSQPNRYKKFLYQDELFYVINDINKASAREHILVITKKHYRSAWNLPDQTYFDKMKQIGVKILQKLQKQNWTQQHIRQEQNRQKIIDEENKYRFGFHLPPYNSIDHVHLHGFLQPIQQWKYNKVLYGWVMTKIQEMLLSYRKKINK